MPSWAVENARVAKFGKRDGFKIHCPKGLAGSSPAPGTPRSDPHSDHHLFRWRRQHSVRPRGPTARLARCSGMVRIQSARMAAAESALIELVRAIGARDADKVSRMLRA